MRAGILQMLRGLSALEGDRRPLGIMLVIMSHQARSLDDRREIAIEIGDAAHCRDSISRQ